MDAQQFAYWLQGFAELSGDEPPTPAQWKSIREHLGLVFEKVTPPVQRYAPNSPEQQKRKWHEEIIKPGGFPQTWPPQTAAVSPVRPDIVRCTSGQAINGHVAQTYC